MKVLHREREAVRGVLLGWNQENFPGVRVFHLGPRGIPANIDIALVRRVRTRHEARFAGNWFAVFVVTNGRCRLVSRRWPGAAVRWSLRRRVALNLRRWLSGDTTIWN